MSAEKLNYNEIHENIESDNKLISPGNLGLISDLEVDVDVVVGSTKISVSDLYNLKKGGVLKLEQDVDALIDIKINNHVVAKGELHVIDDNFAIKIIKSTND